MDLSRDALKERFKTGKMLTEGDFSALIDGAFNLADDAEKLKPLEVKTPPPAAPTVLEPQKPLNATERRHKTFATLRLDKSLNAQRRKPPSAEARLHSDCLLFGGRNNGKQIDSAQISAGLHQPDSLNIVGMASDGNAQTRKLDIWAEGGMTIRTSKLQVAGPTFSAGLNVTQEAPNHLESDGTFYRYRGQVYLTVDDHLYLRHQNSDVRFHFNTHNARLGIGVTQLDKAQLSLGKWNEGPSGPAQDGGAQLLLSGKHNTGVNKGSKNGTYKIKIEGYNNDGDPVYPIYCEDENNNIDFWVKNRPSDNGKVSMFIDGYIQHQSCAFSACLESNIANEVPCIPFTRITLNEGEHFNQAESCYKAPVAGIYQFNLQASVLGRQTLTWQLLVNGEAPCAGDKNRVAIFSVDMSGTVSSASFTLKLAAGDKVQVCQMGAGKAAAFRSSFSGLLMSAS